MSITAMSFDESLARIRDAVGREAEREAVGDCLNVLPAAFRVNTVQEAKCLELLIVYALENGKMDAAEFFLEKRIEIQESVTNEKLNDPDFMGEHLVSCCTKEAPFLLQFIMSRVDEDKLLPLLPAAWIAAEGNAQAEAILGKVLGGQELRDYLTSAEGSDVVSHASSPVQAFYHHLLHAEDLTSVLEHSS